MKKRSINLNYLNQVNLFRNLEVAEKMRLIDGLGTQEYQKGDFVFHEGDVGEEFFIIEQGECECLKEEEGELTSVRVLTESMHFGEIAILRNVKRTLSVRALSDKVKLLVLSRSAF